jgi:tetratricopeptide (TPR) repeat protein
MPRGVRAGYDRYALAEQLRDGLRRTQWSYGKLTRAMGLRPGWKGSLQRATGAGGQTPGSLPEHLRAGLADMLCPPLDPADFRAAAGLPAQGSSPQALSSPPAAHVPAELGQWLRRSERELYQLNYTVAEGHCRKALDIARPGSERARALALEALTLRQQEDFAAAETTLGQVRIELARDYPELQPMLRQYGPVQALHMLQATSAAAEAVMLDLRVMGDLHFYRDELPEARAYFDQLYKLGRDFNDKPRIADACHFLGRITVDEAVHITPHVPLGRPSVEQKSAITRALAWFDEAQTERPADDSVGSGHDCQQKSKLYGISGKTKLAKAAEQQALDHFNRRGAAATVHLNRAQTALWTGLGDDWGAGPADRAWTAKTDDDLRAGIEYALAIGWQEMLARLLAALAELHACDQDDAERQLAKQYALAALLAWPKALRAATTYGEMQNLFGMLLAATPARGTSLLSLFDRNRWPFDVVDRLVPIDQTEVERLIASATPSR